MTRSTQAQPAPEAMDFSLEADAFRRALGDRLRALYAQTSQPMPLDDSELEFLHAAGDASARAGLNTCDPSRPLRDHTEGE